MGGVGWRRKATNMWNVLGNTISDGEGNEQRGPVSNREVRHVGLPEVKANMRYVTCTRSVTLLFDV